MMDRGADANSCATLDVDLAKKCHRGGLEESWTPTTTALHAAARQGNSQIVTLLCGAGADIDGISNDIRGRDRTALLTTAEQGNCDMVRLLCEAKADPDCRRGCGAALTFAAMRGDVAMVRNGRASHWVRKVGS
jgi:ankyrin repeat protein